MMGMQSSLFLFQERRINERGICEYLNRTVSSLHAFIVRKIKREILKDM
jgi:hypothetical protein